MPHIIFYETEEFIKNISLELVIYFTHTSPSMRIWIGRDKETRALDQ